MLAGAAHRLFTIANTWLERVPQRILGVCKGLITATHACLVKMRRCRSSCGYHLCHALCKCNNRAREEASTEEGMQGQEQHLVCILALGCCIMSCSAQFLFTLFLKSNS